MVTFMLTVRILYALASLPDPGFELATPGDPPTGWEVIIPSSGVAVSSDTGFDPAQPGGEAVGGQSLKLSRSSGQAPRVQLRTGYDQVDTGPAPFWMGLSGMVKAPIAGQTFKVTMYSLPVDQALFDSLGGGFGTLWITHLQETIVTIREADTWQAFHAKGFYSGGVGEAMLDGTEITPEQVKATDPLGQAVGGFGTHPGGFGEQIVFEIAEQSALSSHIYIDDLRLGKVIDGANERHLYALGLGIRAAGDQRGELGFVGVQSFKPLGGTQERSLNRGLASDGRAHFAVVSSGGRREKFELLTGLITEGPTVTERVQEGPELVFYASRSFDEQLADFEAWSGEVADPTFAFWLDRDSPLLGDYFRSSCNLDRLARVGYVEGPPRYRARLRFSCD